MCIIAIGAQCFPRLARPLCRAVLMQLHSHAQAAPGMARSAENEEGKRMQSHAPYRCMAFFSKNGRIFGEFYTD
ncbi:hypothetical protein EMJ59_19410 [Escherichia coli]|nr:hypothetical protein [Escherichia coli]